MKVEKCVSEVVEWMNNAVSAQAKKSLDQDPAVHSSEIKAKLQVSTIKLILEASAKAMMDICPLSFHQFRLTTPAFLKGIQKVWAGDSEESKGTVLSWIQFCSAY